MQIEDLQFYSGFYFYIFDFHRKLMGKENKSLKVFCVLYALRKKLFNFPPDEEIFICWLSTIYSIFMGFW